LAQTCHHICILQRQECFQHHQGAIRKCKILLIIHYNHFLVTKMFAGKKSAASKNFLELSWRVLWNFYSFFVYDIVFFVCDVVFFWPQAVTTLSRNFWCSATHLFALFCCQQGVVLQFLASLRIVNHFHCAWCGFWCIFIFKQFISRYFFLCPTSW
jgi:hypothetical protein